MPLKIHWTLLAYHSIGSADEKSRLQDTLFEIKPNLRAVVSLHSDPKDLML